MTISVYGASTLSGFSPIIESSFQKLSGDLQLIQIHGSPKSLTEDAEILHATRNAKNKIYLIHRPDELLLHSELFRILDRAIPVVHFGDLLINHPSWKEFNSINVIPHPFLSLEKPRLDNGKFVIGAYTTWGEMRDPQHFLKLMSEIEKKGMAKFLSGRMGGPQTLDRDFFVPHFNVQLYHLNGQKRLGESSGSLHRGISIPIIFEANGIERVEGLKVIKVDADDKLAAIDFAAAVREIESVLDSGLDQWLEHNQAMAEANSSDAFANKVLSLSKG